MGIKRDSPSNVPFSSKIHSLRLLYNLFFIIPTPYFPLQLLSNLLPLSHLNFISCSLITHEVQFMFPVCHRCRAIHWHMHNLRRGKTPKQNVSSPTGHQLTITLQLGWGLENSSWSMLEHYLVWSCTGNHRWCEFFMSGRCYVTV